MLVAYDLLGTVVPADCMITHSFAPRKGFLDMVARQRALGWRIALFADDTRDEVVEVLGKAGLGRIFDEVHTGEEFDQQGLKDLSRFGEEAQVVFVGDMPRDLRAAQKYGASFVGVPPFSTREEKFDFASVQEVLEACSTGRVAELAKKRALCKTYEGAERQEWSGEGLVLKVFPARFEARFY